MSRKFLLISLSLLIAFLMTGCAVSSSTTETTAVPTSVSTTTTSTTTTTPLPSMVSETESTTSCKAISVAYNHGELDYRMVFYDEFVNSSGVPSILKWKYQTGDGGWGNDELQYYTEGLNSSVADGNLIITARREDMGESHYTSSRMNSVKTFLYGKFVVRAKLPQGSGTWPAIWMMPDKSVYGSWPASGEIDIMEHVGTDMNRVHFSIHTDRYNFKIGTQKTYVTTIQNVATEFHDYQLEWLPDRLIFSVDDVVYFIYDPTDYVSCPTDREWPYDKPFYLILNLAIGGWGGTPYAGFEEEDLTIDYVRVYQADNLFS